MPYYDLKCKDCGKDFNIKASIKEREKNNISCPSCGSNKLEPVFNSVNIIRSRENDAPPCAGGCCSGSCPMQ